MGANTSTIFRHGTPGGGQLISPRDGTKFSTPVAAVAWAIVGFSGLCVVVAVGVYVYRRNRRNRQRREDVEMQPR
ncbi:hypothetical protein QBC33DRAFT_562769 [Phialemonium atrogriseum]|uniref:Uncharacterized protein n=1 Tax=Phialemonium atrogriseum TaxID=1093897 RepID=A0AAJ0FDN4_9PEZI|nr:uncharacterized protein QBC33DRAFT_562769 [Phialemonium atrogriseum]KAK1763437.1 hypothetical protein QBC33DRAFT_562769 [Phialemonium atrogriseum]